MTGTPSGIGFFKEPKNLLRDGDEFRVEISGGLGESHFVFLAFSGCAEDGN